MLTELNVKNFAIIDSIHIVFRPGLNIVSGETGAGKSVLLKSLCLLMGEKAQSGTVRVDAEQAVIEGAFDLSHRPDIAQRLLDQGFEALEETLVVRRVLSPQGKGRVYINGSLCALNSLRDLVAPMIELTGDDVPLIEMTSQHENRTLISRQYQMDVLDHYCSAMPLRRDFSEKLRRLREIDHLISQNQNDARERAQRLDFLRYQLDEIQGVKLQSGEIQEIETQIFRLRNASHLLKFFDMAEDALYGGEDSSVERLDRIWQKAQEMKGIDAELRNTLEPLRQAKVLIEDVVYDLRKLGERLESNPEHLEELEGRLNRIRHLQKKYGSQEVDIQEALEQIQLEIAKLDGSDEQVEQLELEQKALNDQLNQLASKLHQIRKNGAELLAAGVNDELTDLNMKGVRFSIHLELSKEWISTGSSQMEFMIQTSRKAPAKPLSKYASGGELSRILLALKQVVGHSDLPRTYLFDEVDTGVSGETADKVGRKLKAMAKNQQVICVTHLAQVAAFADSHFCISKEAEGDNVAMSIRQLKSKERIDEIARLVSGEKITKASRQHAQQLLQSSPK
jgi:DNA repair protein RecN (Recombination protein N)